MFFKDIPGHQEIKQRLIQSRESGKVAHAQLFIESPGGGGLALVLAYARYLLCQNPGISDACGQCPACHKMDKLIHPDVLFTFPIISPEKLSSAFMAQFREQILEFPFLRFKDWMQAISKEYAAKQGNISAEETRTIIRNLSLKSVEGSFKIQVIWGAEYLGKEGNVLLKILEEPPENTVFLLIGHESDKILPTILSRTQFVRVPRYADDLIESYLIHHESAEVNQARICALLSEGDLMEAVRILKQEGGEFLQDTRMWLNMSLGKNPEAWLSWVEKMGQNGKESQKQFLLFFLKILQRALYRKSDFHAYPSGDEDEEKLLLKLAERLNPELVQHLSSALSEALTHLERNAHARLVFFNLSLTLHHALWGQGSVQR